MVFPKLVVPVMVFTLSLFSAQVSDYPGLSQHDGVMLLLSHPFGFLSTLLSVVGLKTSLPISSAWIHPPDASALTVPEMSSRLVSVAQLLSCHSFATRKTENKLACVHLNASSTLILNIPHSRCNRGAVLCFTNPGFTAAVSKLVILAPMKI